MAWTDDELRTAIHAVGRHVGLFIDYVGEGDGVTAGEVHAVRRILTALGIDHQPKPELPTEVGSMIYDVVGRTGSTYSVMTLNILGVWLGVGRSGHLLKLEPGDITSFGGVLDLDKVRGEQGE